jgi:hypothetical protein
VGRQLQRARHGAVKCVLQHHVRLRDLHQRQAVYAARVDAYERRVQRPARGKVSGSASRERNMAWPRAEGICVQCTHEQADLCVRLMGNGGTLASVQHKSGGQDPPVHAL